MEIEIENNLEIVDKNEEFNEIPVVDSDISYDKFFRDYLQKNQPCILKNITKNWNATHCWIKENKVNYDYLKQNYGSCNVTVYDCNQKYFNSHKTQMMTFTEYLEYFCGNTPGDRLLYLKDWHLKNAYPTDPFYDVPKYFASDWLNEYLIDNELEDYRFVYMGVKGTWTPFHSDVFNSYSWSANVWGKKRWIFYPPGAEMALKNGTSNLPYDLNSLQNKGTKYFEIIQNVGEAVFVPSNWHHQVWNLEDTISINHNWINGWNIQNMWSTLETNLLSVKKEIDDCRDMDNFLEHCQTILNASCGMNFENFIKFLRYIAKKRIDFFDNKQKSIINFDRWYLGQKHALFDLDQLKGVLEKVIGNCDIIKLKQFENTAILDEIDRILGYNSQSG